MLYENIIILIVIFTMIDLSKVNHLWSENFHRRLLHHFQGNQFNPNKNPWIRFMGKTITKEELKYINNIKNSKDDGLQNLSPIASKIFGGNYSSKTTLYYNDFSRDTQIELDKIGNRIKPQLEKLCGKKLYLGKSSFRCVLLRYEGKNAEFTCHYDTEPHNCYRTLFLVNKQGKVPPFIYYNKKGEQIKKQFEVGEGLFFKGTQTFHCVDKSKDDNMKRYMIGWQYSTDNSVTDDSLCSKLRSESKFNLVKMIGPSLIIPLIIGQLFKYYTGFSMKSSNFKYLIFGTIVSSLLVLNDIFKEYKTIGTKIPINIEILLKILIISIISFMNIPIGLLYYNYLILTEISYPRKWLVNNEVGLFKN